MKNTKIAWTDHSFSAWCGCTKVSPGCDHCFAATWGRRFGVKWGPGQPRRRTSAAYWRQPLAWNAQAGLFVECGNGHRWQAKHQDQEGYCPVCGHPESDGVRPRVFCGSLMDWLDPEVPVEWLADLLDLIRRTPNLDWQLLSKRPERWSTALGWVFGRLMTMQFGGDGTKEMVDAWLHSTPPPNVWVGATVEDQQRADERIPALLAIPAKVRFLSCEPLIGPLDLQYPESLWPGGPQYCCNGMDCACQGLPIDPPLIFGLHWVICGAESGPHARPMATEWAISLRQQCQAAGVPFFAKQMVVAGKLSHDLESFPPDLRVREFPKP